MFNHLPLRTKLIAIVVPPLVVLALIATYGVLIAFRGSDDLADLTRDLRTLGGIATIGLVVSGLGVVAISRTITDPLEDIRVSATELAQVRLPLLVEALRNPGQTAPTFAPIESSTDDELGQLIQALNDVQSAVAEVAAEQQQIVRKGLSDLVVNLARRNQSLLDRQIEAIDDLESKEQDPDTLESLFGLDHLATRMRRNAESLLVLAGAEGPRRRGGPVATVDILRVAMSEIEDYRRVELQSIDGGEIGSQAAVDLAHLCSELMENAAQFSPPDRPVTINGMTQPDGCYLISIADHGIGMSEAQLASANHVLANPPDLGLGLSRSLGFIVIGRLAQRLDVRVELIGTDGGGTTALVLIPAVLLGGAAPAPAAPTAMPATAAAPAPAEWTAPVLDEAPWSPPSMPERGAAPLLERSAAPLLERSAPMPVAGTSPFADDPLGQVAPPPAPVPAEAFDTRPPAPVPSFDPTPPAPAAPAAPVAGGPIVPGHPEIQSEALAKLLGLMPPESASTPQAPASSTWSGPVFQPADTPLTPSMPAADLAPRAGSPARLDEAIPSGAAFDSGIDSLFDPNRATTDKGLARRDRTQSQAPVSEGRPIAASVRSPEEIRQMLARYRDGRSRPTESTDPMNDPSFPSNGGQQ